MNRLTLLLAVVLVTAGCSGDSPNGPDNQAPIATEFTLSDVDGNQHTLSSYRGKVVVLNFFATWCGPCQEEMPKLQTNIWEQFKDKAVMVLGIDLKEDLGPVKIFALNFGLTFPLAIDHTGSVFMAYTGTDGQSAVPFNVIIDKEQRIRYAQTGYRESDMIKLIGDLL